MKIEWGPKAQEALLAFAQKAPVPGEAHMEWSALAQAATHAGHQADHLTSMITDLIEATIFRDATVALHGQHSREADAANKRYNEAFHTASLVAFNRPPSGR